MKRLLALTCVAATLAVSAGAFVMAQTPPSDLQGSEPTAVAVDESTDLWFVELASPPRVEGTALATLKGEKDAFRRAAARKGLRVRERYAFDTLWNGLSVRVDRRNVDALKGIAGVKAIYPVARVPRPEPDPGSGTDLYTALGMTGADIAQGLLGLDGAGVKVAIMDTGIDYDHPDLGGCFGPGCRVAMGYDFVGDAYNADPASASFNPVPVPDPDPDDCGGHGTHVAGIVGARGAIRGVAPGVTFGAYRVFGCQGSTEGDIMIAAMERALQDGMQVLNMSIGSAYQWPQYPTAVAADRLVKKGMVVIASQGNNGPNGLYAGGAPGQGKNVVAVASFDNTYTHLAAFTLSPDGLPVGYIPATGAPPAPPAGTYTMSRTGTTTSTADACSPLPAGSLAGTVVLVRRGTCSFYIKAINAQTAGAVGVVLYNNTTGYVSPTVAGAPPVVIPVVSISAADGAIIDGRIAAGGVSLTWTGEIVSLPSTTAGLISSFSSYGVAADLSLKPDLGAPGGNIRSTYPLELGAYTNLSGTSMAAPHVAGAAALLLEAHPGATPEDVKRDLMNTADPHLWWGNPSLGYLDNAHRQGAGMLDVVAAVLGTSNVSPAKLSLGESEAGPVTKTLTLWNHTNAPVTYVVSHVPALATGPNTFTVSFYDAFATVGFSRTRVRVPAQGRAKVDVTIEAPASLPNKSLYGGYVVFTPRDGGPVVRVPYAGFKGDYQSIVALTPTANAFPWLARIVGASYVKQGNGAVFTLVGTDQPQFLVHLDHQVTKLYLEIRDAATDQPIDPQFNRALDFDFVGRNSTATSFFAFGWDGTRIADANGGTVPVPDGTYKVVMKALKALGNPDNPAHWESWTSPTLVLDRP